MQIDKKTENFRYSENYIQKCLFYHFHSAAYTFLNTFFFLNESDWLHFLKGSGYCFDIEVKISRSDYLADFKKDRHRTMQAVVAKQEKVVRVYRTGNLPICTFTYSKRRRYDGKTVTVNRRVKGSNGSFTYMPAIKNCPNRFAFCVPEGLITADEVPSYAGLLYVTEDGKVKTIKKAPLLHKTEHCHLKLFNKMYNSYRGSLSINFRNRDSQTKQNTHNPLIM